MRAAVYGVERVEVESVGSVVTRLPEDLIDIATVVCVPVSVVELVGVVSAVEGVIAWAGCAVDVALHVVVAAAAVELVIAISTVEVLVAGSAVQGPLPWRAPAVELVAPSTPRT